MDIENPRLKRVLPILACPSCGGDIQIHDTMMDCPFCEKAYPIRNGKIYFITSQVPTEDLDKLKQNLKKLLGRYYYTIGVSVVAPDYPLHAQRWLRRYADPAKQIVIDAGSGNHRLDEDIICLDEVDYDAVDIVCDVRTLPFKPASVDALLSLMLLEHVSNPSQVVEAFQRCTRPGGINLHHVPFMYPFHASPDDFQRFTHQGVRKLFPDWEMLICTNTSGPVTLMLTSVIEFLSIVLSFGHKRLKSWFYLLFSAFLFPLKYLDFVFVNNDFFLSLALTILAVFRKPANGGTKSIQNGCRISTARTKSML